MGGAQRRTVQRRNLIIDTNEILTRDNGNASDLALNLSGGDVHMSGMIRAHKINDIRASLLSNQADLAVTFFGTDPLVTSVVQITNAASSAFRPIQSNEFRIGSSSHVKVDRKDFDPLTIVKAAKSQKWKYRPGYADDRWQFGPMADDLPDLRTGEGENASLSLNSLVGVLWEAVRVLIARVDAIKTP